MNHGYTNHTVGDDTAVEKTGQALQHQRHPRPGVDRAGRQAAMLDRCAQLLRFCRRWQPDGAAVRLWNDRAAATARWRE